MKMMLMKTLPWPLRLSAFVILLVNPIAIFGQSTFIFRNLQSNAGLDAPVFDSEGNGLGEPNYAAVLYGGPSPDSLVIAWDGIGEFTSHPMPPVRFSYMPLGRSGYFSYFGLQPGVVIPNVIPGGSAWLQVRAWDLRLGATYEQVASLGIGGYGESGLFYADGGDPTVQGALPAPLIGMESFSLRVVIPEPSPALLLLLGLPLLLSRRSRFKLKTITVSENVSN